MKERRKESETVITVADQFVYFIKSIVSLFLGMIGVYAALIIYTKVLGVSGGVSGIAGIIGALFFQNILHAILVGVAFRIASRKFVRGQYVPSENKYLWLESALRCMIPGEIFKLVFGVFLFHASNSLCNFLFCNVESLMSIFYVKNLPYREQFIANGPQVPMDTVAFVGFYILAMTLIIAATIFAYKLMWDKAAKVYAEEHAELHRNDNKH